MSLDPPRSRQPTLKLVPIPGLLAPHIEGGVVWPVTAGADDVEVPLSRGDAADD
ncbi:MAG: hypothetical protein V3V08_19350 [Nannocystaceae bacterium]